MIEPVNVLKNMEITSQLRFLGISIRNNLKWSSHIHFLCLQLNKACYITKSLEDLVSFYILRNIYFSKFQSLISCFIFWGGESESSKVLKIQKSMLHLMKGINNRKSYRPIFKELKILLPLCTFF
jgi:hypothetical protein